MSAHLAYNLVVSWPYENTIQLAGEKKQLLARNQHQPLAHVAKSVSIENSHQRVSAVEGGSRKSSISVKMA